MLDYKNNSNATVKQLVEQNSEMAYHIVHSKFEIFENDDMYSEALYGLAIAAKKFDFSLNNKFSTFAYKVMYNRLVQYSRKQFEHDKIINNNKESEKFSDCEFDVVDKSVNIEKLYDKVEELNEVESYLLELVDKMKGDSKVFATAWLNNIYSTEDKSVIEIANELYIEGNLAYSVIHRIRKKLKQKLERRYK